MMNNEVVVLSPDQLREVVSAAMVDALRGVQPSDPKPDVLRRLTYLTTNQVAELAGVTATTVRNWSAQGLLRVGTNAPQSEKYHVDEVRRFLLDRSQHRVG
ncbi:MerR family transcriptional regulator [Lewinella sp. JB7]|uniref:MerR family transcriptional regulator n=1 Tax=Lewinella sp. JB7 TaxID=2962887 RepID=UPI0020CA1CE7|nr:helix-turn-helix domain-containing protein [Lewinella sp. JB7]MCP9237189.1 MerR family transcriptional regulator [Lewinella sp. JB7]